MVIRAAQGNNLGEVLTDGINILAGEFTEGINGAVNGFKQFFGKGGIGNFAPNGKHQTDKNNEQQSAHKLAKNLQAIYSRTTYAGKCLQAKQKCKLKR